MNINEYPKAITRFVIGLIATYLTGKVSANFLTPEMVSMAEMAVLSIFMILAGKMTRLTKTEAKTLDETKE